MSSKKSNPKAVNAPVKQLNPEMDNTSVNESPDDASANVDPKVEEGPQPQNKTPETFVVTKTQLEEIADCINSVIGNKYAKQTIFNCLNANITPVM